MVSEDLITVDDENNTIDLTFTPTIPHCSMATLIGLTIRVKLIRSLPSRFKVSVKITEGSHSQVNSNFSGFFSTKVIGDGHGTVMVPVMVLVMVPVTVPGFADKGQREILRK